MDLEFWSLVTVDFPVATGARLLDSRQLPPYAGWQMLAVPSTVRYRFNLWKATMELSAVVDARFTPAELEERAAGGRVDELHKKVVDALCVHRICLIRDTGFLDLPGQVEVQRYVYLLSRLLGTVSDNNRFSTHSGTFVDAVQPTDPGGQDPTFRLGECEAHADESSKLIPEDLVFLWCVQPAGTGGASRVWTARALELAIRRDYGDAVAQALRAPEFLFGGKLREPRRVLKAPILFGEDGIRFRMGTLRDGFDASKRLPSPRQREALRALTTTIEHEPPIEYTLRAGEALALLNRRTLHSRSDFSDQRRLLYRTRCFNASLSNSGDDQASWLDEEVAGG